MRLLLAALMFQVTVAADAAPGGIQLHPAGHGWILTDARGMTLYTYAQDQKSGSSSCVGKCIDAWPPLIAGPDAQPGGEWSVVGREAGVRQWTFRGKPLYLSKRDAVPGDMNGDELQQKWYVAVKPILTPPAFGILKTPLGYLLVDQRRMTLYVATRSHAAPDDCVDDCARTWRPLEAWSLAVAPSSNWTIVARSDGTQQWAFKGKPLYRYTEDFNAGETNGNGVGEWTTVILEPAPVVPPWVTRQKSDGGELYGDATGKTLYGHDPTGYHLGRVIEHPEWWRPVLADAAAHPIGAWSIVMRENGSRQWAHKGLHLYTNVRDREPGDISGVRSGDRVWRPIMTSGQTMPGSGL
jgi:predicted lipoprotein with Yx(FWY)xxD motif